MLTLAAVPVGADGRCWPSWCRLGTVGLIVVPVAASLRLVLNLLDGALARRTGRIHARGELFNEVGDRLADVLMLAPVAFVPGAQRRRSCWA